MAEDLEFLKTPRLKYLSMKRNFLARFLDRTAWGDFGSQTQVIAVASLLQYLEQTRILAEQYPELSSEVTLENKNLVLGQILPLPPKLYELLLGAAVGEGYQLDWQQPASVILTRIEEFLARMKAAGLAAYEDQVWTDVHNYQKYAFDNQESEDFADQLLDEAMLERPVMRAKLRKLRQRVYTKIRSSQCSKSQLKKYESLSEEFFQRFGATLSVEDVDILKKRIERTRKAVKFSKINIRRNFKCDSKTKIERSQLDRDKLVVDETQEEDSADDDDENFVEEDAVNSNNESGLGHQLQISDSEPLILPDVPADTDEDLAEASAADLDDQILARLTKLKLFSHAWRSQTATAATSNVPFEEPSASNSEQEATDTNNSLPEETCAVYSSEQDRMNFNQCYYETIDRVDHMVSQQDIVNSIHSESTEELNMVTTGVDQRFSQDLVAAIPTESSKELSMVNACSENQDQITNIKTKAIITTSEPSRPFIASSQVSQNNVGDEERISLLRCQKDELFASVLYYQSYLIGLVTVFSCVSAKLDPFMDIIKAVQVTSLTTPKSFDVTPCEEFFPCEEFAPCSYSDSCLSYCPEPSISKLCQNIDPSDWFNC